MVGYIQYHVSQDKPESGCFYFGSKFEVFTDDGRETGRHECNRTVRQQLKLRQRKPCTESFSQSS